MNEALEQKSIDLARRVQELQENEQFLADSQTMAKVGSYVLDIATGIWRSSAALDVIFGIDANFQRTVPGWTSLIHPDDRQRMTAHFAGEVLQDGKPFNAEYRVVRHADQAECWVHGLGRLKRDAQGQPIEMLGTIQDITERRQAEEALATSEHLYRSLFGNMLNGLAYCRLIREAGRPVDWVYLAVNDAFSRQTGLQGAVGRKVSELVPGILESDPELLERYGRVATTGVSDRFEAYVDALDMWLEIAVYSPAREHFVAVFDVITERKRAERALAASELKHRVLFESTGDALMTVAPPTWHFTAGNPATLAMFGLADEAALDALKPADISPEFQPDGRRSDERAREMMAIALAQGSHLFEWTHKRADGTTFPATVLLSRLELDGQIQLQGTVRDMTAQVRAAEERERLNDQLRAAQKMEAIGSLAGGIAHDFNNLVTVIQANALFAMEDLAKGAPARENLREIQQAAESAAGLTRQLLAFSRNQVLEPFSLDLNQVVAGVEKMLRRLLREDIQLVHVAAADLGQTLADPGQIEQVLMNLVVNARDAVPNGGVITIETKNLDVDEAYAGLHPDLHVGTYVQLSVTDNGCGMDDRTKERIFEPFFTTKEVGKGTGLGLSTVYGIVKQSGGAISVFSKPGAGTSISVLLPRDAARMDRRFARASGFVAVPGQGETILLVEDAITLRNIAARTLISAGYKVLTAVDGVEAMQVANEYPGAIDLLLTDVVMPRMGGHLLAAEVGKVRPATPVLFMSGYPEELGVHRDLLSSGAMFIAKPFSVTELLKKVADTLRHGRSEAPLVADGRQPVP